MGVLKKPLREFPKNTRELDSLLRSLELDVETDDIQDDAVGDTEIRNSAPCSVIGRSANSTGDPADISAPVNDVLLIRRSNVLAFAALVDADIPATIARDAETTAAVAAEASARNAAIAAAVVAHEAAGDPHPGYTTAAELAAALVGYLTAAGPIHRSGVISPAQITANADDYNPTGLSTTTVLRLSTDASRDLTGIVAQSAGRVLDVHNVGAFDLVLINDATSTAANRFLLGANITLGANEGISIWYDGASSRWRSAGRHT